jgi:hypothetical protein
MLFFETCYLNYKKKLHQDFPDEASNIIDNYYLYITFFTAFTTSVALGNHSFKSVGE